MIGATIMNYKETMGVTRASHLSTKKIVASTAKSGDFTESSIKQIHGNCLSEKSLTE